MKRLNQTWRQQKASTSLPKNSASTNSKTSHKTSRKGSLISSETSSKTTRSDNQAATNVPLTKKGASNRNNSSFDANGGSQITTRSVARTTAPTNETVKKPVKRKPDPKKTAHKEADDEIAEKRNCSATNGASSGSSRFSSASSISFEDSAIGGNLSQLEHTTREQRHNAYGSRGKSTKCKRKNSFKELPVTTVTTPLTNLKSKHIIENKTSELPSEGLKENAPTSNTFAEKSKKTGRRVSTRRNGPLITSTPCIESSTLWDKASNYESPVLSPVWETPTPVFNNSPHESPFSALYKNPVAVVGNENGISSPLDDKVTQIQESQQNLGIPQRMASVIENSMSVGETLDLTNKIYAVFDKNISSSNPVLDLHLISSWGLPISVVEKYKSKGIERMFHWQVDCLSMKYLYEGRNLVYTAPTSAGKTMVAEMLMLRTVLERKKKAVIVLPFISVSREKMFSLQDLLSEAGVRVGGYMGTSHPVGGFEAIDIAICTIEKANSLVNRLVQEDKLDEIGILIVDELHMLGDQGRGYLLELLLTKVLYVCKRKNYTLQIVGMSATLPNLNLLADWLNAELYVTNFRPVPLTQYVKIGSIMYNAVNLEEECRLENNPLSFPNDADQVIWLALETVTCDHGVLIFCPSKDWCEKLAKSIAKVIFSLGKDAVMPEDGSFEHLSEELKMGLALREILKGDHLAEVLEQLKLSPAGLDAVLGCTVPFGVAYHHAGLTYDERDIIEAAFRKGILKVLVATSTLASGVNLPARRVIIRSLYFGGSVIDLLTYTQMIGRAGRKGIDEKGESILICKENERYMATQVVSSSLPHVQSCLFRASDGKLTSSLKRAILEVIANGTAKTREELNDYLSCTLLSATLKSQLKLRDKDANEVDNERIDVVINACIDFLLDNEFIHVNNKEAEKDVAYQPTQLGLATLFSCLSPDESLFILQELGEARKSLVLENELHLLYQVVPVDAGRQLSAMDWMHFLNIWGNLPQDLQRVGNRVGIDERFIAKGIRGAISINTEKQVQALAIHRRFFIALALNDLVHEVSLTEVSEKYNCPRGMLQSLQMTASTYAGMMATFCNKLGWHNLELLISQFQSRLHFGIERELCDLIRLSCLNAQLARRLFNAGYESVTDLANARPPDIEIVLKNSIPFQSNKQSEEETAFDVNKRRGLRRVWITGRDGCSESEAAELMVKEARVMVQQELGISVMHWKDKQKPIDNAQSTSSRLANETLGKAALTFHTCLTERANPLSNMNGPISFKDHQPAYMEKITKSKTSTLKNMSSNTSLTSETSITSAGSLFAESAHKSNGSKTTKNSHRSHLHLHDTDIEAVSNESQLFDSQFLQAMASISRAAAQRSDSNSPANASKDTSLSGSVKLHGDNSNDGGSLSLFGDSSLSAKHEQSDSKAFSNENNRSNFSSGIKASEDENVDDTAILFDDDGNEEFWLSVPLDAISQISGNDNSSSETTKRKKEREKRPHTVDLNSHVTQSELPANSHYFTRLRVHSMSQSQNLPKSELEPKVRNGDQNPSPKPSNSPNSKETVFPSRNSSPGVFSNDCLPQDEVSRTSTSSISTEHALTTFPPTREATYKVTDVTTSQSVFKNFIQSWKRVKRFALSLACEWGRAPPAWTIGPPNKTPNKQTDCLMNHSGLKIKGENGQVVGIAVSWKNQEVFYVSLEANEFVDSNLGVDYRLEKMHEVFRSFANNRKRHREIIVFNLGKIYKTLYRSCDLALPMNKNIHWQDPSVAEWLLDPEGHQKSLREIIALYNPGGLPLLQGLHVESGNSRLGTLPNESGKMRASVECLLLGPLMDVFQAQLQSIALWDTFLNVEIPARVVLAKMEQNGVGFDRSRFSSVVDTIRNGIGELEQKAFALAGRHFALSSPKDVANVLFRHLKLSPSPSTYNTKRNTGYHGVTYHFKTSKAVLQSLKSQHPLPGVIMDWRRLTAVLNNVVLPFLKFQPKCQEQEVNFERLHSICDTHTQTGRIYMRYPCLQITPKDFSLTQDSSMQSENEGDASSTIQLRYAFIPSKGYVLLSSDYSQIELRILAHFCEDSTLLQAFHDGVDIFTTVAAQFNSKDRESVTREERQRFKEVLYSIIYGITPKTLSQSLGISEQEGAAFMNDFLQKYPDIKRFENKVVKHCKDKLFVETVTGRRRHIPAIRSPNVALQTQAKRQALNSVIQGSASDLVKTAMVKIDRALQERFPDTKRPFAIKPPSDDQSSSSMGGFLILHMHDELIYEVSENEVHAVAKIVKEAMESALELKVKLAVNIKVGSSWGDMTKYEH